MQTLVGRQGASSVIAAVLAGHEAPVLPPQLLQWALQVCSGCLNTYMHVLFVCLLVLLFGISW
jgi:hypothetical protein